jgi:hypothetical protein
MGQGDDAKPQENPSNGPQALPIRQYAKDIVEAVKSNSTVVVIGETGSGKTTQLSQVKQGETLMDCASLVNKVHVCATSIALQILYEAGFAENGLVAVTQPRRVVSRCSIQPQLQTPPPCNLAACEVCMPAVMCGAHVGGSDSGQACGGGAGD